MTLEELLDSMNKGISFRPGTEVYTLMLQYTHEAMRLTAELNGSFHTQQEIQALMEQITGGKIDETFTLFPPFHTDFGKNIHIGKHVFINSGCSFQDQGGITIGDGALIGHNAVLATINHGLRPDERCVHEIAPITLGKNVWVGANVTILQGVSVGDNAILAAGAVVTRDVAANTLVGGVPARFIKKIAGQPEQCL